MVQGVFFSWGFINVSVVSGSDRPTDPPAATCCSARAEKVWTMNMQAEEYNRRGNLRIHSISVSQHRVRWSSERCFGLEVFLQTSSCFDDSGVKMSLDQDSMQFRPFFLIVFIIFIFIYYFHWNSFRPLFLLLLSVGFFFFNPFCLFMALFVFWCIFFTTICELFCLIIII